MKRSIYLFLFFCHLTIICVSQNYVQKVEVQWRRNGVWQTNTANAYSEITITPDYGSAVNIRPYRTSNSPLPIKYFVFDLSNNRMNEQSSSANSHLFRDCVGPHNSQVWAGVGETMTGHVTIWVNWSKPALPDLRIDKIMVNNRNYSSGLSFQVGQTVWVRCDVWNAGNQQAGSSQLGFYMKTTSNNTSGSPNRIFPQPPIETGRIRGVEFQYTFSGADIGTRYVVFEADYQNAVTESNESNNVASFGPFQVVSPPNASVTPVSQSFGSVHVNECSGDYTFQLKNNGSGSISGQIRLVDGKHFSIINSNFSLGAGRSRNISITFCPGSVGNKSDLLRVYVDGMPSYIAQASLSGNATTPPASIEVKSPDFEFDTRGPSVNSGGIFLKIIETAGTNMVKKVGYTYSYIMASVGSRHPTEMFDVDNNGFVFLNAPDMPADGVSNVDDFLNEILLFDHNDRLIGHIPFSYSFKNEGMHSRHAVLFFHNDEEICLDAETGAVHFPYHSGSPNNPPGSRKYNYYEYGEYPVSMLIPPHFQDKEQANFPQGYRFPPPDDNVELLIFVHGLKGTFSYQDNFGANPNMTNQKGDQVSYWYGTERAVNHKTDNVGNRKYHAWQFYYPNEDDLRHCAMTLRKAMNYLYFDHYSKGKKVGIIAHSMGGLVTFEYLSTNSKADNQKLIQKVLISQTPSHGSVGANRQYLTLTGYFTEEIKGMDRDAPAYRDMSLGSNFIVNLHQRDWKNLLDFNNSGSLNENIFVLMGLTNNKYKSRHIHTEAANHDDGIVSFSSASLLSKGIGFAGLMGNHEDGKFNAITRDDLMPGLIDAYFSSSTVSDFANYCRNESLIKVFLDGNKTIRIPNSSSGNRFSTLDLAIGNVDLNKGMLTVLSNRFNALSYQIGMDQKKESYIIRSAGQFSFNNLGSLTKNTHSSNNTYYFNGVSSNSGVGFIYPIELGYVQDQSRSGIPEVIGTIGRLNMEHQFVSFDKASKDDSDLDELTPTKHLAFALGNELYGTSLFIDNQSTSAEFVLYSQTYDEDEIPYALQLLSPDGVVMDSTSTGITYQHDYLTSVKRITVNNPQYGEWKVNALFESADGYSPGFITLVKLASGIKVKSLIDQFGHDIQKPITLEAFIEAPDPGLFELNSIQGYYILNRESGKTDTLEIAHIQQREKGIELSCPFSALSPEIYSYTLIVTGIYSNKRFERAVYGDFLVEDLKATLSIPDQQLSIISQNINLSLPDYMSCRVCNHEQIVYEVGIISSTFTDDDIHYLFSSESGVLSISVVKEASLSFITYSIDAFIADSLLATTNFRLSYTPPGVPDNLVISNVTRSGANLIWTPGDIEQQWDIKYGVSGFDPATAGVLIKGVTEIPYALEGLDQGEGYDFFVRAVFDGENNHSAWSWPGSFTTNYVVMISGSPNGAVSPEGTHEVQARGDLYIMFTPSEGYHVEDVLIDGESVGAVSSYFLENILSNQSIYVSFAINKYTISVTVNPENTGNVSGSREYNHGENVSLTATSYNNYLFQRWTEGPSVLSDELEFSFVALRNRNLVAHFSSTTAIEVINKANVRIYPNPVQTRLNVVTTDDSRMQLIRMFDLLGQEVFREEKLNEKHVQIDVSHFLRGIYIVHILTDHGVAQVKIQVSER